MGKIRVLVSGAYGRMGREVARAVLGAEDMTLVGAVDPAGVGHTVGQATGTACEVSIVGDLAAALEDARADVMVDFTMPGVVMGNIETALTRKVACVVGTTGFSPADIASVERLCAESGTPCLIAPNFSIGANLMMRFAAEAAKVFGYAEIIERHHERKADAPSGTALRTAELMATARGEPFQTVRTEVDKAPGSRGGSAHGVQVHAVRAPGYLADQEVIFGGPGERLVISHVTISRECFMPGVLLAVRKVRERSGLTVGLDSLLVEDGLRG